MPERRPPSRRLRRAGGWREVAIFAVAYLTYFGVRAVTEGDAGGLSQR